MYNNLIEEDIMILDNEFFKIDTMFETVNKMYDIKQRELEYNYIYTESINEEYVDLYTEAEEAKSKNEQGLLGRLFTAILNFIRKIRAKILRLFGNDKKASELEAKIKGNPKLANQTVEITNTTDAEKAIDEGTSFFGSLIDKIVKGTATEADADAAEEKNKSLLSRIGIFAGGAKVANDKLHITEKLGNLFKREEDTKKKSNEVTQTNEQNVQKGEQALKNNSQTGNEENTKTGRRIMGSFKDFITGAGKFFTGKASEIRSKINSSSSPEDKVEKQPETSTTDTTERKNGKNDKTKSNDEAEQDNQNNKQQTEEKKDNDSEKESSNTPQSSDSKEQKEEKSSQSEKKDNDSEKESSNTPQSSDSKEQDKSKEQTEEKKDNDLDWWEKHMQWLTDQTKDRDDDYNQDEHFEALRRKYTKSQKKNNSSQPVIGPGSSKKNDNSQKQSNDDDKKTQKNTNTSNKSSGMLASQVIKRFNEMKKALEDGSAKVDQYRKVEYNEINKCFDYKDTINPHYIIDKHSGYVYPDIKNNSTNTLPGFKDIFMNSSKAIIEDPMKIKLPRVDEDDVIISKGEIIDDQTTNESTYDLINNILTIFENSFK